MSGPLLATVVDPDIRSVDLTEERWAHITDGHPELARNRNEVLETVRAPSRRRPGRALGEEWFYRETAGAESVAEGCRTL